jgi:phage shock protein A
MSSSPMRSVICPNCHLPNAAGSPTCQYCQCPFQQLDLNSRPSLTEDPRQSLVFPANGPGPNQISDQKLDQARTEPNIAEPRIDHSVSSLLLAEIQSSLKSAEDRAATLSEEVDSWKAKLKAAEENAASFKQLMLAKAKELESVKLLRGSSKTDGIKRPRLIAISVLTVTTGLVGYGVGQYGQVTSAKQQMRALMSALDSSRKEARDVEDKLRSQLTAAQKPIDDLTAAPKTSRTGQDEAQKDLRDQIASLESQLTNAQAKLKTANRRITDLEGNASRANGHGATESALPGPGYLVWSGNVIGTRTIKIAGGVADYGGVTGTLPREPCTVSSPDPIQFKTRPSKKNGWNKLSFKVTGTGSLTVRIKCTSSQ